MIINKSNKNQSWRESSNSNNTNNSNKKYYLNKDSRNKYTFTTRKLPSLRTKKNINFFQKYKKKILIFFLFVFFVCSLLAITLIIWLSRNLPEPNQLLNREVPQSTKIYDRTGQEVLYEIHGEEERTLVTLEQIPDNVEHAIIAMEDKDFYNHKGFSLWAIFRSGLKMVFFGSKGSGSTLTQQFVKNAILTNERSYERKIKELLLAYKLEKKFSKNEILQMYLNEIPYGSTAYGVEAASKKYFGKHVGEISLAESAILAALPQAPSKYSPYGSNKDLLIGRQQYIIDLMKEQGYISEEEATEAKQQELIFNPPTTQIKAPHFVMYVKEILSEKYGEKMIEQGGLKIYTTLDLYKQKIAEDVIKEYGEKNQEKYNASNAALLAIDPKNGQILTMVGSRDYFNNEIDGQVNIITSKRQPGSSMKPLVYASLFIKGFNKNSILYDVVTNFAVKEGESYEPHNYDLAEHGPVSIEKALAGSLNIPAVKAIYLSGVNNVLNIAQDLGYTTFADRDRLGLSLVLGGAEVKIIEHINAYSAFARDGVMFDTSAILKIEDKDGNIIEEFSNTEKKVIDPNSVRQINSILSNNSARAYVFGQNNWLTLGSRPVAAKTGTTNDYRDAWTIGYTPSIVTGVWVGNNDNSEMKRGADGGIVAAPIWNNFMKQILGDTPFEYFKEPTIEHNNIPMLNGSINNEVVVKIDKASGLLATDLTPISYIEEKIYSEPHSILYYVDKDNPLKEINKNPEKDSQFKAWEKSVFDWYKKTKENSASSTITLATSTPPTEYDNLHTQENLPKIEFVKPQKNENILNNEYTFSINTSANRTITKVEYYIDNKLIYLSSTYPYIYEANLLFIDNGFHNLKVIVCDDIDNCSSKETEFNLILDSNELGKKDIPSISITEPTNGIALTNIDFPLKIKTSINNPLQITKINYYYYNKNKKTFLGKNESLNSLENFFIWDKKPENGEYKLFCEIIDWKNQIHLSEEVTLIIQ